MKEIPAKKFLFRALFFLLAISITLLIIAPSAAAATLGDALDAPALTWTTGGNAGWFGQTAVTSDGEDAAQSGPISHNQQTWMETTVGPGTLSFWWQVSSESNWDWLEFYINGVPQNRIAGNVSWQQRTYNLSAGTNVLRWRYVKDTSVNSGSDCGWVDQVVWEPTPGTYTLSVNSTNPTSGVAVTSTTGHGGTTAYSLPVMDGTIVNLTAPQYVGSGASRKRFNGWSGDLSNHIRTITLTMNASTTLSANYVEDPETVITLGTALDAPALTWTTGGNASWFGQTAVTSDGEDAAQSGPISHNQQTWMQTTVVGPGTISFWWRVSSENYWDWLEFYINGVRQSRIAGNVSWQQKTYNLSAGTNVLQWRYVKDTSVNSGSDCGWVDQVVWEPTP